MKNLFLIGGGVILGLLAVGFVVRTYTPPSFKITERDVKNHKGKFIFGGVENSFGNGSQTIGGRNGFDLEVKMVEDGSTVFKLFHNGKFVKELDKV